jgi:hypothetical protein
MEVMMVKLVKLWLLIAILASGALEMRAADESLDYLRYRKPVGSTPTPPTPASNGAALGGACVATPQVAADSTGKASMSTWQSFQSLFAGVKTLDQKLDGVAQAVGAVNSTTPNLSGSTQKLGLDKTPSFLSQHPNLKTSLIVGGGLAGVLFVAWSAAQFYHMSRAWLYDIKKRLELVEGSQPDNLEDRRKYFKLHKMYATNSNWGGISATCDSVLDCPNAILTTDLTTLRHRLTEDLMSERIFVKDIDTNRNTGSYSDVPGSGKRLNRSGLEKIKKAIKLEQDEFIHDMQRLQKYFTLTPAVPTAVTAAAAPVTAVTVTAATAAAPVTAVTVTPEHRWGKNWAWSLAGSARTGLSALAGSSRSGLSAVVTSLLRRKVDDTLAISAAYENRLVAEVIMIVPRPVAAEAAPAADAGDGGVAAAPQPATAMILANLTHLQEDQIQPVKTAFLQLVANSDTNNNEYANLYFDVAMAYVRLAALEQKIDKMILEVVALEAAVTA